VALARASVFTSLLAAVDLLDELSGVAFVGAPDVRAAFRPSYGTAALVLFLAPQLLSLLLEPPIFVLADRVPRKRLVVAGLMVLGLCQLAAGLASSLGVFVIVVALSGPASGIGVNLAQATLMDSQPTQRERLMARWALMGQLGDLGTPLLFAALAKASLGWRDAFLVTGFLIVGYATLLALLPFPERTAPADEPQAGLGETLATALRNRRLMVWLCAVSLCSLLDEVLVAFAALYLEGGLGAGAAGRGLVLACFVGGSVIGLLLSGRLLRRVAPVRLLRWAAAAGLVVFPAWIAAPDVFWSAVLLGLVGVCTAPLYPIAQAQAYRALPGRSGLVNAAAQAFLPLELALPFVIGWLADRFGLEVALSVLALQPLGLFLISLLGRRAPARPLRRAVSHPEVPWPLG